MSDGANWLDQLLSREIFERIRNDRRTLDNIDTLLGWPKRDIFSEVIDGGQADFDAPVGHLSGDDRALLYADFNQKRHLDELAHAFRLLIDTASLSAGTTLVDIGCGPFTAGLSFAKIVGAEVPFRYFGVDRSSSMRRLGERLAQGARCANALHERTSVWFGGDISQASFGPLRGEPTIVVASYLLASPTIDPEVLAQQIAVALDKIGTGLSAVLYTNSSTPYASRNFSKFKNSLLDLGFEMVENSTERFTDTEKQPKNLHYALFMKPAVTTILINETSV